MPSLKASYLIAYNASCIVGWSYVLFLYAAIFLPFPTSLPALISRLSQIYSSPTPLPVVLSVVQLAAVMEIVHAFTGMVSSPAAVTAMQVMSRVVALFALVYSPVAQTHYGAGLMILG